MSLLLIRHSISIQTHLVRLSVVVYFGLVLFFLADWNPGSSLPMSEVLMHYPSWLCRSSVVTIFADGPTRCRISFVMPKGPGEFLSVVGGDLSLVLSQ